MFLLHQEWQNSGFLLKTGQPLAVETSTNKCTMNRLASRSERTTDYNFAAGVTSSERPGATWSKLSKNGDDMAAIYCYLNGLTRRIPNATDGEARRRGEPRKRKLSYMSRRIDALHPHS